MANTSRTNTSHRKVTTSVLLWDAQAQLLGAAAARKGMNVSEFVREVLIPHAAREAGYLVPTVPALEPRKPIVRHLPRYTAADLARAVAKELGRRGGTGTPPHRLRAS